jgi:carbamoyltransferase
MALGKVNDVILQKYRNIFSDLTDMIGDIEIDKDMVAEVTRQFVMSAQDFAASDDLPHEDMLASFQAFMQELLLEHLQRKVTEFPGLHNNLCIAGGCALNIKWNNSIRNSKIFKDVWVPPIPNDAGSAIGAACCEMMATDGLRSLEWSVYSGPAINSNGKEPGNNEAVDQYSYRDCSLQELAYILHEYNEPVVFLNERAEMGPRALGNRSILAPAVSPTMKKRLNEMKNREDYRPVAPICLEEYAPSIFTPGAADPYMLFEHYVNETWKDKIPAICHLDGSARLQTVNEKENNEIYRLLLNYYKLSGVPLLCNTSANLNGRGFFPDVQSAMKWNKSNLIWSNYVLYVKNEFVHFEKLINKSVTA